MGWTSYHAEFYKNRTVDRKKEMDKLWTQKESEKYPELNVLKSSIVGSVYYAAIEVKRNEIVEQVIPMVVLTSVNMKDYFNFAYKEIGLYYYDCSKGILDLLTDTDNEHELEWRKECKKHLEKKRMKLTKGTLPVGSIIKFTRWDNEEIVLEKMRPSYQFNRPWWYRADNNTYYPSKYIPEEFEIIKKGA